MSSDIPVFISCQHTATISKYIAEHKFTNVKASTPKFNIENGDIKNVHKIDVPTFGGELSKALYSLLNENEVVTKFAKQIGFVPPKMTLDTYFTRKYKEMHEGIAYLNYCSESKELNEKQQISCQVAAIFITNFLDKIEKFPFEKASSNDYSLYLIKECRFPQDYGKRLQFVQLLELFGFDAADAKVVFELFKPKLTEYLRLYSKALEPYKLGNGCLADAVNSIYAVMNRDAPKNDEKVSDEVVKTIIEFNEIINKKDFKKLTWVPRIHINDGELDDKIATFLLQLVLFYCKGELLHVVMQTPGHFDKEYFSAYLTFNRADIIVDNDSRNVKPFEQQWGHKFA